MPASLRLLSAPSFLLWPHNSSNDQVDSAPDRQHRSSLTQYNSRPPATLLEPCTSVADHNPTPLHTHPSPVYLLSFTLTSSSGRGACTVVRRLAFILEEVSTFAFLLLPVRPSKSTTQILSSV